MLPLKELDVQNVFVSWKNIAGKAPLQKINRTYIISLEVYKRVLYEHLRLQEGTDPGDEGNGPVSEENQLFEDILVDEEGYFEAEVLRQFLQKISNILDISLVLVF